ncbi:probable ribose-5-phosphate isomerase 4, chloroplastic [Tanacetum coccineum]
MVRESWEAAPGNKDNAIRSFMEELRLCDELIDKGMGSSEVVQNRLEILNKIHQNKKYDLEQDITKEEVKRAMWDCGDDKSLASGLRINMSKSKIMGVKVEEAKGENMHRKQLGMEVLKRSCGRTAIIDEFEDIFDWRKIHNFSSEFKVKGAKLSYYLRSTYGRWRNEAHYSGCCDSQGDVRRQPESRREFVDKIDIAFNDAGIMEEGSLTVVIGRQIRQGEVSLFEEKRILDVTKNLVLMVEEKHYKSVVEGSIPVLVKYVSWMDTAEEIDNLFVGDAGERLQVRSSCGCVVAMLENEPDAEQKQIANKGQAFSNGACRWPFFLL